jgi:hypothetical protein
LAIGRGERVRKFGIATGSILGSAAPAQITSTRKLPSSGRFKGMVGTASYFVWKGLKNYGYQDGANNLADKTLKLLANDLAANGSLNEYYHPDAGAALSVDGFVDWNLLVLEMM